MAPKGDPYRTMAMACQYKALATDSPVLSKNNAPNIGALFC